MFYKQTDQENLQILIPIQNNQYWRFSGFIWQES